MFKSKRSKRNNKLKELIDIVRIILGVGSFILTIVAFIDNHRQNS